MHGHAALRGRGRGNGVGVGVGFGLGLGRMMGVGCGFGYAAARARVRARAELRASPTAGPDDHLSKRCSWYIYIHGRPGECSGRRQPILHRLARRHGCRPRPRVL